MQHFHDIQKRNFICTICQERRSVYVQVSTKDIGRMERWLKSGGKHMEVKKYNYYSVWHKLTATTNKNQLHYNVKLCMAVVTGDLCFSTRQCHDAIVASEFWIAGTGQI